MASSSSSSAAAVGGGGAAATTATVPTLPVPEPVEEDDEFEDFQEESWGEASLAKADLGEWTADWDDDEVETDIDKQIKAELAKNAGAAGGGAASSSTASSAAASGGAGASSSTSGR